MAPQVSTAMEYEYFIYFINITKPHIILYMVMRCYDWNQLGAASVTTENSL